LIRLVENKIFPETEQVQVIVQAFDQQGGIFQVIGGEPDENGLRPGDLSVWFPKNRAGRARSRYGCFYRHVRTVTCNADA